MKRGRAARCTIMARFAASSLGGGRPDSIRSPPRKCLVVGDWLHAIDVERRRPLDCGMLLQGELSPIALGPACYRCSDVAEWPAPEPSYDDRYRPQGIRRAARRGGRRLAA